MPQRLREKYRQSVLCHLPVFDGAADGHIFVPVFPVGRQASVEAVDALCKKNKAAVTALTHHIPTLAAPFVGIRQQKVGGEAGHDGAARCDSEAAVAAALAGKRKGGGLSAGAASVAYAEGLVSAVNIAVEAAGAYLGAAVPRIPAYAALRGARLGGAVVCRSLRTVGFGNICCRILLQKVLQRHAHAVVHNVSGSRLPSSFRFDCGSKCVFHVMRRAYMCICTVLC